MQDKGSSLIETRRRNRVLIKHLIFRTPGITRTELAQTLGLTKPTITTSVNAMLKDGFLEEKVTDKEIASFGSGRKPLSLAFKADSGRAIGIELGPYATKAILMNMRGNILNEISKPPMKASYPEMLEQVTELIGSLLPARDDRFLGAGIGLPGFIDNEHGLIRKTPRANWSGFPFVSDLQKRLQVPIFIDNNVRLRAIGQDIMYYGQQADTFAYFFISKGIACPLMVQNQSLSGCSYGAGELGHTFICRDPAKANFQSVDDLASETALMERCQQHLLDGTAPRLQEELKKNGKMDMDLLLSLEREGDPCVTKCFEDTLRYAGIALANVVNLINPGLVVVDAYMMQEKKNRDFFVAEARKNFYGLNEEDVHIHFAHFDGQHGARGAAYYVIMKNFLDI